MVCEVKVLVKQNLELLGRGFELMRDSCCRKTENKKKSFGCVYNNQSSVAANSRFISSYFFILAQAQGFGFEYLK